MVETVIVHKTDCICAKGADCSGGAGSDPLCTYCAGLDTGVPCPNKGTRA